MSKQLMALALAAAAMMAVPAEATTVALASDGNWNEFNVDSMIASDFGNGWIDDADGSALSFTFTVPAGQVGRLTVVDAGFAGDAFTLTNFGAALGTTSGVAVGTTAGSKQFDFDAALADPAYSRGLFTFGAGSYSIGGSLLQSVLDGGVDLDATNGAVRLSLTAVPEPAGTTLMLGGLAALALIARRRQAGKPNHSL